jgi:MoxR-like ATPase
MQGLEHLLDRSGWAHRWWAAEQQQLDGANAAWREELLARPIGGVGWWHTTQGAPCRLAASGTRDRRRATASLVVGEPGIGKTRLLEAAENAVPSPAGYG